MNATCCHTYVVNSRKLLQIFANCAQQGFIGQVVLCDASYPEKLGFYGDFSKIVTTCWFFFLMATIY